MVCWSQFEFLVTPADYEPPGFQASDLVELKFTEGRVELPVGKLHSVWHVLELNVNVSRTMLKDDFTAAAQAAAAVSKETPWTRLNVSKDVSEHDDSQLSLVSQVSLVQDTFESVADRSVGTTMNNDVSVVLSGVQNLTVNSRMPASFSAHDSDKENKDISKGSTYSKGNPLFFKTSLTCSKTVQRCQTKEWNKSNGG